jgi:DNA replication protein DnaC
LISVVSNALGMAANRNFYTVKYIRLPELFGELAVARAEGRYAKAVKLYKPKTAVEVAGIMGKM